MSKPTTIALLQKYKQEKNVSRPSLHMITVLPNCLPMKG